MKNLSLEKWAAFLTVSAGIFMSTVDGSILNVALPTIMDDLSAPLPAIQWVVMAYLLIIVTLLMSFGRLADIRGLMTINTLGLALFTGGSLLCALSPNVGSLIFFRGIQGLGASMVMACGPAILTRVFPPSELGRAMGLIGSVVGVGLTSGPGIGGLVLSSYSWRVIFYINVPLGLASLLLSRRFIPRKPVDTVEPTFDFMGALLLALALAGFLLAVSLGGRWGWNDAKTLASFGVTLIFCPLFILWELRITSPVVDLSLFGVRVFRMGLSAAVCLFVSHFISFFLMPFYLTKVLGRAVDRVGLLLMVAPLTSMVISPISGWVSDKVGARLLTTAGMMVTSVGLLLASWFTDLTGDSEVALFMVVMGMGAALFQPPNTSSIMRAVPSRRLGVASGLVAAARNLGMVTGISLAGALFSLGFTTSGAKANLANFQPNMLPAFLAGWKTAFLFGVGVAAVGAVLTFLREKVRGH
jgi:EmrB/QacA subfamily drug resistance transporter